jgi:hypothetical protein
MGASYLIAEMVHEMRDRYQMQIGGCVAPGGLGVSVCCVAEPHSRSHGYSYLRVAGLRGAGLRDRATRNHMTC